MSQTEPPEARQGPEGPSEERARPRREDSLDSVNAAEAPEYLPSAMQCEATQLMTAARSGHVGGGVLSDPYGIYI